jgi:hypothetical protein
MIRSNSKNLTHWLAVLLWIVPLPGLCTGTYFDEEIRPLLATFCFDCHDEDSAKAGVDLAQFRDVPSLHRNPKLWENVLRQIEERAMPPSNKRQPPPETYHRLVDWLRETLNNPDPELLPRDPGQKLIHRLSRPEYNYTILDLFGVDTRPADKFPPDGGGGAGFDNNADTLFLPPVLMERYLAAADDILLVADPARLFPQQPVWYSPDRLTARNNLTWFLRRAFRRPVTQEEVDRLMGLYQHSRQAGQDFNTAMKIAYKAALVSPHFLFRIEWDPSIQGPGRISNHELANRLSYFLWSSMPDDALLAAADRGELWNDNGLARQVRRMLQDPKSRRFSESFIGQWLGTRKLPETSSPDIQRYPKFDVALRSSMMQEPVEFIHFMVQNNRPLLDLLDSDYTFADRRLADLYELPPVDQNGFIRVSLPDRRRGGVTGMAAVLTQTSYPRRTSPVLRGKWILEEILGTPAPPPPPIVATLPQDDRIRDNLTLRQRLEQHREKANCATCHSRLDPLGFALENFDAIGGWRTQIDTEPVDASGVLPNGREVDGPEALKDALLEQQDLFLRHATEKLLAYALGRGLEYYDIPTVKEILHRAAPSGYGLQTLILEIARSYPFQYRRGSEIPLAQMTSGDSPQ